MKKLKFIYCAVIMFAAGQLFAQSEEDMKAWQAYMTPTESHKMLAKDVGKWKTEMSTYMDEKSPAIKSVGTSEVSMILGDRYQQSIYKGDFMGMPFEGIGTTGYDNAKKIFISTWVDNMGTGVMTMEGKWDKPGKVMTFLGKSTDPRTGKDVKVRQVLYFDNDDTQRMEMFMNMDGKEMKNMDLKMTRM